MMNSKKFVKTFVLIVVILLVAIAGLNYYTSPFGLFKDKYFDWFSYDMTQNPRIAKVEYLKKNKNLKYSSFIVGASGASSFPSEDLKKYTGKDFYNTFYYGADMLDSVNTVKWLVKHYDVENIIMPIGLTSACYYNVGNDTMNNAMHYELDGTNPVKFYAKYLLANPNYGLDKLKSSREHKFLQQSYTVFNVLDGSYDKSLRDIEPISNLEEYKNREIYHQFNYDFGDHPNLGYIDEFIKSMEEIVDICKEKNIDLKVLVVPMYHEDFKFYDKAEVEEFYKRLAEVTDYYDFCKTSVSYDARYFYDRTHFRNDVGRMMLSYIYGDEKNYVNDYYVPKNFGIHVGANGTYKDVMNRYNSDLQMDRDSEKRLPVFMYHHFAEVGDGGDTISYENFKTQIKAIKDAGYRTVTLKDLDNFIRQGKNLPDKAVLITMDDGYRSNTEFAYKMLKENGFNAVVFPIGSSIGKDTYKETNHPIIPHFSIDEAKDAMDVLEFGSHSFDMHQSTELEEEKPVRNFAIPLEGEDDFSFVDAFRRDVFLEEDAMKSIFSKTKAFAYPGGYYSDLTAVILSENDYRFTFLTEEHQNYLLKGLRQSGLGMGRFNMTDHRTYQDTINLLEGK